MSFDDNDDSFDAFDSDLGLNGLTDEPPAPVELTPAPKRARAKKGAVAVVTHQTDWRRGLVVRVKSFYDFQTLRMQIAGRINRATGPETQLAAPDVETLKRQQSNVELLEKDALKELRYYMTESVPFYKQKLKEFPGVGLASAAVILSMFDITKADTVSKFWAFAGLRPMPCRRCSACQRVVVRNAKTGLFTHPADRVAKKIEGKVVMEEQRPSCAGASSALEESATFESSCAQRPTSGQKLPYSAFLRSKLCGAMGSAQITNATVWRKTYDDYKHRKQTAGWGVSDGHRHKAAMRYMVKQMLLEIWKAWRTFEGLEVRPSYHEEKQGGHGYGIRGAK